MTSKEKAAKKLGPIAQGVGKLGMLALLADEIKKPDKLDAKQTRR